MIIVEIPQGSTAYQANDGKYYGRSEFEVKHLRDHDVRVRMNRGRVAQANLILRTRSVSLGDEHEAAVRAANEEAINATRNALGELPESPVACIVASPNPREMADVMTAKFARDEVSFDLIVQNVGELTIRNPVVILGDTSNAPDHSWVFTRRPGPGRYPVDDVTLYPNDEVKFNREGVTLACKRRLDLKSEAVVLKWKILLDNSPMCQGVIDVGLDFQRALDEEVASRWPPDSSSVMS